MNVGQEGKTWEGGAWNEGMDLRGSLMEEKACPGVCSWSGTSAVVDLIDTRAAMALPSISKMVPPSTSSSRAKRTYSSDFITFKVVKRALI